MEATSRYVENLYHELEQRAFALHLVVNDQGELLASCLTPLARSMIGGLSLNRPDRFSASTLATRDISSSRWLSIFWSTWSQGSAPTAISPKSLLSDCDPSHYRGLS